jgi:hypothetical protein
MPVEIRELIIRAVVSPEIGATAARGQEADEDRLGVGAATRGDVGDERQAIIQECVRQVLRILQQQKGR